MLNKAKQYHSSSIINIVDSKTKKPKPVVVTIKNISKTFQESFTELADLGVIEFLKSKVKTDLILWIDSSGVNGRSCIQVTVNPL
jgi:hypothetical protein